ncbi:MAG: ABC transporter permease [Candidatus Kapabacteria bacterium]|nr:ABC transporter permease [Candidatus Kapabacteria bacterium]
MNIFKLLLRFFQQRTVPNALTVLAVAVGVALTASILTLRTETERSFSQKDTGFEIIVGAKGSPLQLVLNTMYHLGAPVGNFPLADCERIQADKRIKSSLPMVFGDNVGGYKVVGTTTDFFTKFEYRKGLRIGIAQGKPFDENFEAVLGAEVAQQLGLKLNDSLTVRHGLETNEQGAHDHGKMPVVGILAPTGTAIDRGVYMTMRTVWDTHYHEYEEAREAAEKALGTAEPDHKKGEADHDGEHHHDHDGEHHHDHDAEHKHDHDAEHKHEEHPIPPEFTSVTALAVKLKSPVFYDSFMRNVNDGTSAQAAVPIREIAGLFQIVGNVSGVLLGISYMVIVLGAISIIVALYTSLNERRREIAILRSLGAHKRSVVGLILAEASLIGFVGSVVGLGTARLALRLAEPTVQAQIGTTLTFGWWYNYDALLLGGVVVLTGLVSLLPALTAYRTDVAENLAPMS